MSHHTHTDTDPPPHTHIIMDAGDYDSAVRSICRRLTKDIRDVRYSWTATEERRRKGRCDCDAFYTIMARLMKTLADLHVYSARVRDVLSHAGWIDTCHDIVVASNTTNQYERFLKLRVLMFVFQKTLGAYIDGTALPDYVVEFAERLLSTTCDAIYSDEFDIRHPLCDMGDLAVNTAWCVYNVADMVGGYDLATTILRRPSAVRLVRSFSSEILRRSGENSSSSSSFDVPDKIQSFIRSACDVLDEELFRDMHALVVISEDIIDKIIADH